MKTFTKAFERAKAQLASDMSTQLKRNAQRDGWPNDVASGLSVKFDQGSFVVGNNPEHSSKHFDLEYGTESQLGKGTVRKMYNSPQEQLDRFATIFEKKVVK